jgi:hypothetical protein
MRKIVAVVLMWLVPFTAWPQTSTPQTAPAAAPRAWVAQSDAHAKVILDVLVRFGPEQASFLGIEGFDEAVLDLQPQVFERSQKATREALATLESRLAAEKDPAVRQDLQILVQAVKDNLASSDLQRQRLLPYFDIPQTIFQGLRALLDDQVSKERRAHAVVRLRR